jgi:hypothetical protein
MLSSQPDHRDYAAASVARHAVQIHGRYKVRDGFMTFALTPVGPLAPLGMLTGSIQGLPAHGLWPVNRSPAPKSRSSRRPRFGTKQSNLISAVSGASRAVCDLMGTLQQQTQRLDGNAATTDATQAGHGDPHHDGARHHAGGASPSSHRGVYAAPVAGRSRRGAGTRAVRRVLLGLFLGFLEGVHQETNL